MLSPNRKTTRKTRWTVPKLREIQDFLYSTLPALRDSLSEALGVQFA